MGPVGRISPMALYQIYWPRALGQWLISQTGMRVEIFFGIYWLTVEVNVNMSGML